MDDLFSALQQLLAVVEKSFEPSQTSLDNSGWVEGRQLKEAANRARAAAAHMSTLYADEWTEFQRAEAVPMTRAEIEQIAAATNHPVDVVQGQIDQLARMEIWKNNRYQVLIDRETTLRSSDHWPAMILLSIKRLDREAVHDWRDLQRIKNELTSPMHEAVELYPAEKRLTDAANQYHLWVLADPTTMFPFGFTERFVMDSVPGTKAKQRPMARRRWAN